MKKFVITTAAVLMMCMPAAAAQVNVNGELIDAQAVIVEGRTLVPVRGVFEKLGYSVEYDANTKTAVLTKGSSVVEMTAGNTYFTVNGENITPEVPQQIIDSRFMLPLRAVGEAVGAKVDWDAETKTAVIERKTGLKIADVQTFPTESESTAPDDIPVNEISLD